MLSLMCVTDEQICFAVVIYLPHKFVFLYFQIAVQMLGSLLMHGSQIAICSVLCIKAMIGG